MTNKIETVGNLLYWAYANLAMAHVALKDNAKKYNVKHFGIRSKLFNGLTNNKMNIKSFFDDERLKMILPQTCNYCGSTEHLSADHIIPVKKGGLDIGENLVWACRSCNSSKSANDLLEWMNKKQQFPSILLYRKYLKILITYCRNNNIIDKSIKDTEELNLPFNLKQIPQKALPIENLKLWVVELKKKNKTNQYRIANWNVERPKNGTKKTNLVLDKINEINADILVLTETSKAINLEPDYQAVKSNNNEKNPDEQWITIWSKWKIIEQILTFDKFRTACALIEAPFGQIIIYGTIIPYHAAGVKGNRYKQTGYKNWQLHYEDIINQSSDWNKIISNYPNTSFFVIGDFNQTRNEIQKGYGTSKGRELLTKELQLNNLKCVTEIDFTHEFLTKHPKVNGKTKKIIDHICVSTKWIKNVKKYKVGAWNRFDKQGYDLSDHNGVYIDFNY